VVTADMPGLAATFVLQRGPAGGITVFVRSHHTVALTGWFLFRRFLPRCLCSFCRLAEHRRFWYLLRSSWYSATFA